MGTPTSTVITSENVVPSLNPHPLPHLSPKPIPLISMVIMAILTTEVTTDTPIGTLARGALMPNPWPDPNPKPKERLIPNPFTMVIMVIVMAMVTTTANKKDFNRKADENDD